MFEPIHHKTAILPNLISRSPLRHGFLLIPLALAWFALSPTAQAVSPAPDGGYSNNNTAEGDNALSKLTTGSNNTATGFDALFHNTFGGDNTATGSFALTSNTIGDANIAIGSQALFSNTTGFANIAIGSQALFTNTFNSDNTAIGHQALYHNTGDFNTATGFEVLFNNTTGFANTANGGGALSGNTTGDYNTATGFQALLNNTTSSNNTADGADALLFSNGSNNIALGSNAGINLTTGNNNIDIGAPGVAGESNTIRIGVVGVQKSAYMRGISGVTVAGGVGVIIDTNGHLGTVVSSERFKDEIKPMDKASEAILALKPVTFRYKPELDPDGIPQFGLVAEQVEKVNPDLVVRDAEGKINTVRYEAVNAMLLNEFLKEHRKVEDQGRREQQLEATIVQQQNEIKALTASLKEQAAQIQKVSDQLKASKAAPQLVADNQ